MYIHKCFKPSKCLPFEKFMLWLSGGGVCTRSGYTDGCKWCSVSMVDCNGTFFFSLTKADSIVPIS